MKTLSLRIQFSMAYRDVVVPRQNKSIATIRVYDGFHRLPGIGFELAHSKIEQMRAYNFGCYWATRTSSAIATLVLVGGFVAIIWWPWWIPNVGLCVAIILYRANNSSTVDFAREIIKNTPAGYIKMTNLGIAVLPQM